MKIAIIDDEAIWHDTLKTYLLDYYPNQTLEIEDYYNGMDFLNKHEPFDLLFLDIEMPGMDGFEAARQYRIYQPKCIIIVLTSHTELSRKGYQISALRYLDKAELKTELEEALQCVDRLLSDYNVISLPVVHLGNMDFTVKDILYVEIEHRKSMLHTYDDSFAISLKLEEIEKNLPPENFFRCHKSCIVNLDRIIGFDNVYIYLPNNNTTMVSSRKLPELKKRIIARKISRANA